MTYTHTSPLDGGSLDFTALVNPDAGGWAAFVAVVVATVTAVARGWLVPRRTVDTLDATAQRVAAVQAERLADSRAREEEWHSAWTTERARGDLQVDQIGELLELARTNDQVLRALKSATGGAP